MEPVVSRLSLAMQKAQEGLGGIAARQAGDTYGCSDDLLYSIQDARCRCDSLCESDLII